jgi:PDZ domain
MGLFNKIFRGKKKNREEDPLSPQTSATTPSNKKTGWRSSGKGKDPRSTSVNSASPEHIAKNSRNAGRSPRLASPNEHDATIPRNGSFTNTYTESNSSRERDMEQYRGGIGNGMDIHGIDPRDMTQEQLRIMYERSRVAARGKVPPTASGNINTNALNKQYDENLAPSSSGSMGNGSLGVAQGVSSQLTANQLQQWDRQVSGSSSPLPGMGGASSKPIYTMSSELTGQQMQAMDDMNRSDASSSSFNLSTDAEDSEYEMLKRRGGYPGLHGASTLDTSAIDTATSYTTDEDRKIFPNLPTDDEMTQATEPSLTQPPSLLVPLRTPDDEPGRISIFPQNNETSDDLRAWTLSPSSKGEYQEPPTTKSSTSRDQHFFASGNATGNNLGNNIMNDNKKNVGASTNTAASRNNTSKPTSTSSAASRNMPGTSHRNFTSPKSQASTNTDFSTKEFGKDFAEGFGDFSADFGNFADFGTFPTADAGWQDGEEKKMQPWEEIKEQQQQHAAKAAESSPQKASSHQRSQSNPWSTTVTTAASSESSPAKTPVNTSVASPKVGTGFPDSFDTAVATNNVTSTSSGFRQDTSLSELLEAAKSKRRPGSRSRSRPSSSSVNSAPAITASYLRQHHNLGRYSTGTYQSSNGSNKDRLNTTGDGTSVSDIIESLEATHTMKRANNVYSHRSVGDTGALATARAAKERLRERRRRERENQAINNNRSAEMSDSDESDHEASESWLFDEVTGALGPRGIAADLESLSGRSNRSKNSHGNKSHKSRRKSRKSSSRRPRSDRSVDSHGSRTSRNSRYSHRSTKSFLSQMSEQSRSVANDLLRLERQLAMVASEDIREDSAIRTGSSSASLGGTSRGTSRTTSRKTAPGVRSIYPSNTAAATASAVVRRTKITVMAPPGKLGIILANKADSKGTVVSGVRTSSVLVDRISPGDRIVAIDGEDVSRMTVSEITTIMSRKAEYERRLTVLTVPKPGSSSTPTAASEGVRSPRGGGSGNGGDAFETSFSSNYRR